MSGPRDTHGLRLFFPEKSFHLLTIDLSGCSIDDTTLTSRLKACKSSKSFKVTTVRQEVVKSFLDAQSKEGTQVRPMKIFEALEKHTGTLVGLEIDHRD